MRALVTGSRTWIHQEKIWEVLDFLHGMCGSHEWFTVITGACPTGADEMARQWATDRTALRQPGKAPIEYEPWPAHWDVHGRRAGFIRNHTMVANSKPDIGLAYIRAGSAGATDCMTRLIAARVPTRIFIENDKGEFVGEDTPPYVEGIHDNR